LLREPIYEEGVGVISSLLEDISDHFLLLVFIYP